MKKFILLLLLPFLSFSQDFSLLKKIDDVEINYRFTRLESKSKNDNYVLDVNYKNAGNTDVNYLAVVISTEEFGEIKLTNATKINDNTGLYLFGERALNYQSNNRMHVLKPNKEYYTKTKFQVPIGTTPTIEYTQTLDFIKDISPVKPNDLIATLNEGLVIKAILANDINGSNLNNGDKLNFELAEDIMFENYVAVKKGAKILGTVTDAKGSKMLGKKGKLSFTIDYLYLPNGKILKLRSSVTKQLNGSGAIVAGASILLTPFALFLNGKNAKYDKGTIFETYLDETVKI